MLRCVSLWSNIYRAWDTTDTLNVGHLKKKGTP